MAIWNSQVRGHIIAIKQYMGWDPTEIVGEGNLVPTPDNPNAFTGLPDTGGQGGNTSDKPPAMDKPDIPSTNSKGDPYAGMGKF